MYVIVAYQPHRTPAVYGPVEDRHPAAIPEPAHSIVRVPLHPVTTRLGTTPADPETEPVGWPRTVHASRRLAAAIAAASPPPVNLTPVVMLLASPTSGLLTAIGPFTTTAEATTWLHDRGHPGGDITATAFPLHTSPVRPSRTTADSPYDHGGAGTGQGEEPAMAPRDAPTASSGHRHRLADLPEKTSLDDATTRRSATT